MEQIPVAELERTMKVQEVILRATTQCPAINDPRVKSEPDAAPSVSSSRSLN